MVFVKKESEESPLGFTSNNPEKRISMVRNTVVSKCRMVSTCLPILDLNFGVLGDDPFPAWISVVIIP